jgi:hypothetical protein
LSVILSIIVMKLWKRSWAPCSAPWLSISIGTASAPPHQAGQQPRARETCGSICPRPGIICMTLPMGPIFIMFCNCPYLCPGVIGVRMITSRVSHVPQSELPLRHFLDELRIAVQSRFLHKQPFQRTRFSCRLKRQHHLQRFDETLGVACRRQSSARLQHKCAVPTPAPPPILSSHSNPPPPPTPLPNSRLTKAQHARDKRPRVERLQVVHMLACSGSYGDAFRGTAAAAVVEDAAAAAAGYLCL